MENEKKTIKEYEISKRFRRKSELYLPNGISPIVQDLCMKIFISFSQNKELKVKELLIDDGYSAISVRKQFDYLKRRGWVRTKVSEIDRRIRLVLPTEKLILAIKKMGLNR
jgi:hypothetical protein